MVASSAPLLYGARALALGAAYPALRLYRRRYRGVPTVQARALPEARPRALEGYADRPWYRAGDRAAFHLRAPGETNEMIVERAAPGGAFLEVERVSFGRADPPLPTVRTSEDGCGWPVTLRLALEPSRYPTGYYRATLRSPGATPEAVAGSAITFLVQNGEPGAREVLVVAPTTTWSAYNPYGGRSLYVNEIDGRSVHVVARDRPNHALSYDGADFQQSATAQAAAFAWLDDRAGGADLLPDDALAMALAAPERFAGYRLVVLLYHNEYVTADAYAALRALVRGGASLLALGANQLYWHVRWHADPARLECRKDATPFADGRGHGGLWRHTAHPEDALLGVRFTDPGTGTYAPFRVTAPEHWLFEGTGVARGDLFGLAGTTGLPICGDETDKLTLLSRSRARVVAQGLNRVDAPDGPFTVYDGSPSWDGAAGGALALTPLSANHGVLATGAIHSASGLGADPVFESVVGTFLGRALDRRMA